MTMYRVGVIGLGKIAHGYATPADSAPYCHVGGIRLSERVELAAVADISEQARQRFRAVWGDAFGHPPTYYESSAAMLEREPLDIVAVCVRGPDHAAVMQQALAHSPKAVFLEKPPSCSLAEMDEMVSLAREHGIPITVSYSRHWSPHILRLEQLVREGLIGEVRRVVAYTGGGVLSFASHSTDLICQFAGYYPMTVLARGRIRGDAPPGYQAEPELEGMIIEFADGVTGIQVGGEGEHGNFYCEVWGSEGMVRAGMYIPPYACTGKRQPIDLAQHQMPGPASVFTVAYDQIAEHLDGGPLPACTNEYFVATHEIGFAAIESMHRDARIALPNQHRERKVFANG